MVEEEVHSLNTEYLSQTCTIHIITASIVRGMPQSMNLSNDTGLHVLRHTHYDDICKRSTGCSILAEATPQREWQPDRDEIWRVDELNAEKIDPLKPQMI